MIFCLGTFLLVLFGWFLFNRFSVRRHPDELGKHNTKYYKYTLIWFILWWLRLFIITVPKSDIIPYFSGISENSLIISFVNGLTYLFGCTFLLVAIGGYVFHLKVQPKELAQFKAIKKKSIFPEGKKRIWIFLGVGGVSFTVIFLEIIFFQMLTIFGDYLTANSIISTALLGIAVGGLIGFFSLSKKPLQTIISASFLLPIFILIAFFAIIKMMDTPLLASILMMLPFVCASVIITIVLARAKTYFIYFIDLIGAAIGALLVSHSLSCFREEGSVLILCAFTFLIVGCFVVTHPSRRIKTLLTILLLIGFIISFVFGFLNLQNDWLNIVRIEIKKQYPRAKVLFSKSSFVGRYDIIRRKPYYSGLSTYENGRITDHIRKRSTEEYQIDPRVPHTLMKDPVTLIIGLSGDGITKTAKCLSKKVYGVEINPATVRLQTNELVKYNSNSYKNIDYQIIDGRTYIDKSNQKFDIITLMNSHTARGRTSGRAPSPEYLHTYEAIESYLEHLTERGVLIIEEPVNIPRREPPIWKLLVTMQKALLDNGITHPEQHFFIFQWKTKRNNYIQILMKKTPLSNEDILNLKQWLWDVDNRKKLEKSAGQRLGPITTKTTILHTPDEPSMTNYSRILKGDVNENFLQAHNLNVTTDDRPFHFDVDPSHPEIKKAYSRTLFIVLILLPVFLLFLIPNRAKLRGTLSYIFIVSLTGLGYLLIEIVLMQRYEIFLGLPIITFSTVLGTLLVFSGLGSLWSGHIGRKSVLISQGILVLLLLLHLRWIPSLLPLVNSISLTAKVALSAITLAPLAFLMGVPFPFILRIAKSKKMGSPAILFAISGVTSALAVPLALNISTSFGLHSVFQISIIVYVIVGLSMIVLQNRRSLLIANSFVAILLLLILISPWLFSNKVAEVTASENCFRVYGISYGYSRYKESKLILGGSSSNRVPFEWLFWVIKGNEQIILVDTGFDDSKMASKWKISHYVQPTKRLSQLGISPLNVSDIILTHSHWDHMGGLAPYKNAKIWIQEKEYDYVKSIISPQNPERKGIRWKDWKILLTAEEEGRLRLINGDKELIPGITMRFDGSHTPGSQYVIVETIDGSVIIAGDTNYLYKNNQWHKPIGSAYDHNANLSTIQKFHKQVASPFLILPGHDPFVMKWFPQVSKRIVQITTIPE